MISAVASTSNLILFSTVKPNIYGFSSTISLLADFLHRFHRQDPLFQFQRFEEFGIGEEWHRAISGLCSFVQRATRLRMTYDIPKRRAGIIKQNYGFRKQRKSTMLECSPENLSEQLKDLYRQLLQMQLHATNFAHCLDEMCDLVLQNFGEVVV